MAEAKRFRKLEILIFSEKMTKSSATETRFGVRALGGTRPGEPLRIWESSILLDIRRCSREKLREANPFGRGVLLVQRRSLALVAVLREAKRRPLGGKIFLLPKERDRRLGYSPRRRPISLTGVRSIV
jgi:hypothetical protein